MSAWENPQLTQDLVDVLADVRGRRPYRARRPRQGDGRALDAHLPELAVLDGGGQPQVLHLLVLEGLLDIEDGPAGHALGVVIRPVHSDVVTHGRPSFGRRRGLRAGTAGCPYTGRQSGPLSMDPPPPFSCRPGQSGAEPRGLRADRSSAPASSEPSRLAFVSPPPRIIPGVGRSIRSPMPRRTLAASSRADHA